MTRTKLSILCGSALLGGMSVLATPALANDAMMELIEIMRKNGSISEQEYRSLKNAATADKEQAEAMKAEVEEKVKDMPTITTKEKLAIKSSDGNWEWGIGGRIMADAAFYENDGGTDYSSGHEIRRARLNMTGKFYKVWNFKTQIDFANDSVSIKDAYIGYDGFDNVGITVGHFKEPFSLEELTSSKYITFMERSLPNAFAPGRALGIAANSSFNDMFTVAGGVFGDGLDSGGNGRNASGYGVTGRVTFSPIHRDRQALHFGAAVSHRQTDQSNDLRFRSRFEEHVSSNRLVDTGTIPGVDDFNRFGLEAAGVYERFSLQGEYIYTDVNTKSGFGPDGSFDGYYIYGSVFLTDDSRPYKFSGGKFDKVAPSSTVGKGGIGAWEVGLRFSSLDLNDSPLANGGKIDNLTVGLNWYATKNVRLMANYTTVLDNSDTSGPFPGAEPAVFQTRAQVFW